MLAGKRVLLIIGGGVAAYKSLLLIRELQRKGASVRCVLTAAGAEFVTPLSVGALSGDIVYQDLFDLTAEAEMGHIELSRSADLLVVAPATADLMAKMAQGLAGDLASTLLLATDTPVMIAPSMNVRMWEHPATQENLKTLKSRGVLTVGPDEGDMACGEFGFGRVAEPEVIANAIAQHLVGQDRVEADRPLADTRAQSLRGKRVIVTSGPTHEPIDPVRYIANRSSGKQGHAIAAALAAEGAEVILVSGPTRLDAPKGCTLRAVETAEQMLAETVDALPADAVVCAAAVADYRVETVAENKLKKQDGSELRTLSLVENPDILKTIAHLPTGRPALVIGFAAETENVVEHASDKRSRKGCDWIIANDVSTGTGTFGGDDNQVTLVNGAGAEAWPRMTKSEVAKRLAAKIAEALTS
jgi:phosphopantothenoylcysteine decarboxylase/phosphopantothenate--cysteine ligase